VTCGEISLASIATSLSNSAAVSVRSSRQRTIARSSSSPRGAPGRSTSVNHANVVSSGAIIPARPPPSIVMLQTVIRPSIDSASIAGPAYSTTCPVIPPTPRRPSVPRIRSFAVTPKPSSPS
jgi:hypothetical protein